MLTKGIEVMKYVRASAGRAGLSVQFERVNQPRHDGKTIYLPQITNSTTLQELKQLMASVDHEVAHDRFSSFDVLKAKKVDPKGLLMFVWNFLEDSRINNIEANEYRGFKENWDEASAELIESILTKAKKSTSPSLAGDMATALICWDAQVSAYNFPMIEAIASTYKPKKKIFDVLSNYSDRLVACHETLDKKLGTESTFQLALDILKELGQNEEELLKEYPQPKAEGGSGDNKDGKGEKAKEEKGEGDTEADAEGKTGEGSPTGESSKKAKDDEYKVITITLSEEDINKYSSHVHFGEETEMGKVGVNIEPIKLSSYDWDLTDFNKFVVVDYPRRLGKPIYYDGKYSHGFLHEYESVVGDRVVAQENFAQQVRRLIQIRAKVQRQYGVKKGKLDQSRLARICFNAPGFNERVFKNKIENKTLDAAVQVLVDMSGSMGGEKAFYALASTLLVAEVCTTLNIPLEILGFTDDGPTPVMFIYKAFNDLKVEPEALKKNFALSSGFMYGNPDGENILWAHDRLIKRKEKKKLLLVMSDGSPAASKAMRGISEFTHKAIQEIEAAKVVDIYGLGLLSYSVEHYYKAHSVVMEVENIPNKLLELIERKILT